MSNIFQIHKDLEDLFYSLPETGEMTDEQIEKYDSLGLEIAEKHKSTIGALKHFESQEEAIDNEIKRLKALKEATKRKQEQILYLVDYTMKKMDTDKLEVGIYTAKRVNDPPSVEIDPSVNLPEAYTRKKIEISPDKDKIKEALKNGTSVEGCRLVQGTHITIK